MMSGLCRKALILDIRIPTNRLKKGLTECCQDLILNRMESMGSLNRVITCMYHSKTLVSLSRTPSKKNDLSTSKCTEVDRISLSCQM